MRLGLALAGLLALCALAQSRCACWRAARPKASVPAYPPTPSLPPASRPPTRLFPPHFCRELLAPGKCNGAKKAMCGVPAVCTNLQTSTLHCEHPHPAACSRLATPLPPLARPPTLACMLAHSAGPCMHALACTHHSPTHPPSAHTSQAARAASPAAWAASVLAAGAREEPSLRRPSRGLAKSRGLTNGSPRPRRRPARPHRLPAPRRPARRRRRRWSPARRRRRAPPRHRPAPSFPAASTCCPSRGGTSMTT